MSFYLDFFIKRVLISSLAVILFSTSVYSQEALPRDNGILSSHGAPRYRASESHPLRIVAYALHPVGWVLREAIFRPLSAFAGSTETTRSVMGFREPFDYREPHCFSASDDVPDCRNMAPYNALSKGPNGDSGFEESKVNQVYFPDVNFEFNKSTLNDLGKGRVRQIASLIKSVPNVKIVVEGHTDFKGSDDYNTKLGEARAKAVIAELQEVGVSTEALSPISYGESKPVFTEETDWARAVNRRVQFTLGDTVEPSVVKASFPESDVKYE